VAVYLNGVLQGYLSVGLENELNGGNGFPIAVGSQLAGKNRIRFVQKTAGWTWGVTNLLVARDSGTPPEVQLTVDALDTRGFGHNYGSNQHETELIATFEGGTMDLVLSVSGYDIDYADEVAIYLNGVLQGYLSVGAGDSLNGGDSFSIPAGGQVSGENRIRFVQKTAGWTWGVTNLLLEQDSGSSAPPDVQLTVDEPDTGQYGYNYGSNQHETELIATFEGGTTDLVLSVSGYDIDYADEVAVYLNGVLQGYLSVGLDDALNGGDSFCIPVVDQLIGENRIRFVQKTAGWTWGVTNLLVAQITGSGSCPPQILLTVDVLDIGQYGHNYGSDQHETELIATFEGGTSDLMLSVSGYDIDHADEVAVYLNGVLQGYLSVGLDNGINGGNGFPIPVGSQLAGENQVKLVQKTAGWKWGVTNLLVARDSGTPPEVQLTVDVLDTRGFGHNYGSNQHETELIATFEGGTSDLVLSVSGYDIDYADEVAVYLNGVFQGYLSAGANNGLNSGNGFPIMVGSQLTGENRIRFVQKTVGWKWGVTNLLVARDSGASPEVQLTVDVLDTRGFGHNYGSNQHETELIAAFEGGTTDLVLSVSGYDIDYADEVAVYLNDVLQGYLSAGANNGHNGGDSFSIPAGDQVSAENRIRFVQKTAGWKWGVINLLVAP
jgi:ABC-type amino acid transport substrate-binding protein